MTKLLTEQELKDVIRQSMVSVSHKTRMSPLPDTPYGKGGVVDIGREMDWLLTLIQSQKQAHADMVIGKDADLTAEHIRKSFSAKEIPQLIAQNNLRAEQRKRNSL